MSTPQFVSRPILWIALLCGASCFNVARGDAAEGAEPAPASGQFQLLAKELLVRHQEKRPVATGGDRQKVPEAGAEEARRVVSPTG